MHVTSLAPSVKFYTKYSGVLLVTNRSTHTTAGRRRWWRQDVQHRKESLDECRYRDGTIRAHLRPSRLQIGKYKWVNTLTHSHTHTHTHSHKQVIFSLFFFLHTLHFSPLLYLTFPTGLSTRQYWEQNSVNIWSVPFYCVSMCPCTDVWKYQNYHTQIYVLVCPFIHSMLIYDNYV